MKLTSSTALACGMAAAALVGAEIVVNRVVDDFAWSDPFGEHATPPGFEATCEATGSFRARQYRLGELQKPEPLGLKPWATALKYFFGGRPFPGSWDGVDAHGTGRDVVLMPYADVPEAVKRWIEARRRAKDGDGAWLFAVYHKNKEGIKIKGTATPRPRLPKPTAAPGGGGGGGGGGGEGDMAAAAADDDDADAEQLDAARLPPDEDLVVLFAAGALYHVLPLWVAEGSACEPQLLDLARYGPAPRDGGVAAWVVDRAEPDPNSDQRDVSFTIKAQVLRETDAGRAARLAREEEEEEAQASVAAPAAAKVAESESGVRTSRESTAAAATPSGKEEL